MLKKTKLISDYFWGLNDVGNSPTTFWDTNPTEKKTKKNSIIIVFNDNWIELINLGQYGSSMDRWDRAILTPTNWQSGR